MKCPYCHADSDRVTDSRSGEGGAVIRRRRECLSCKRRFTTYERVEENPLKIIKKNGGRVPYDRDKLRIGVERACWNLPVSPNQIDKLIAEIEAEAFDNYDREVPSRILGDLVLKGLRSINEIAYIRFASVYREFHDVGEFLELVKEFRKDSDAPISKGPLLKQTLPKSEEKN